MIFTSIQLSLFRTSLVLYVYSLYYKMKYNTSHYRVPFILKHHGTLKPLTEQPEVSGLSTKWNGRQHTAAACSTAVSHVIFLAKDIEPNS